jgi:predicted kinase
MQVRPGITLLAGPSFAGKSTFARESGHPYVDWDRLRDTVKGKERWNVEPDDVREAFEQRVREEILDTRTVIVEWLWVDAGERRWLREFAAELGVPIHLVVFDNETEIAERRAEAERAGSKGVTEPDADRVERTERTWKAWPELRDELGDELDQYASVRFIEKSPVNEGPLDR